jgi:hypothetical protein
MSRQEASWHEHLAGMRAAEAARKQGGNPAAIDALATATAGPVRIAGFDLYPASQGTIWTLKRVARQFTAWADRMGMPIATDPDDPGTREMIELGLATLVFCDSQQCWIDLETGKLEELIARADHLIWKVGVNDLLGLQDHFQTQMARLGQLSADDEEPTPGKLQPVGANGISPETATPPAVAESPPSNG